MSSSDRTPLLNSSVQWELEGGSRKSTAYRKNSHLWTSLAVAAACLAIGGGVGLSLLGRAFSENCSNACALAREYQGCLSWGPWFGIMMILFLVPFGILSLGSAIVEIGQKKSSPQWVSGKAFALLSLIAAFCLIIVVMTWKYMLKPATLYDYTDDTDTTLVNDVLLVFIGGFLMITFTALFLVCVVILYDMYASSQRVHQISSFKVRFPLALTPSSFMDNWPGIVGILTLLLACAFSNATFSSVWNYSAHSYFLASSPYSLISGYVDDKFSFKLYGDTVVFYTWVATIVLLGTFSHFHTGLGRFVQKRIRIPSFGLPKALIGEGLYPHGVTVGESFVVASTVGLFIWWIWFWRTGYSRIYDETGPSTGLPDVCCNPLTNSTGSNCTIPADEHRDLQTWARVFGELGTLCMAFLLFPVARNSMWESVFGIPFERAIKYHRFMGVVTWVVITVHMFIWMVKWAMEKTLANNIFSIDYLQITPQNIHFDNFTVLINETTWLLLTVMLVIALWKRRDNYELFYYSHHFAIIYMCSALLHAWSFWYYTIGGLILWLIDRCIRLVRSARPCETLSVEHCKNSNVTKITLPASTFSFYPGQYAFVCVPRISHLEWHPFTISSAPSAGTTTFHIKDMGANTWTNKLAQLAKGKTSDVNVRVDGPYGRPLYFDKCTNLVLVAGGIGITPMHSIVAEVLARVSSELSFSNTIGSLTKVTLIWCTQSAAMFGMFSSTLSEAMSKAGLFNVHLHCTYHSKPESPCVFVDDSTSPEAQAVVLERVVQGRPNIDRICASLPSGSETMLMVCGPEAMIKAASDTAYKRGFTFHSEVFHF